MRVMRGWRRCEGTVLLLEVAGCALPAHSLTPLPALLPQAELSCLLGQSWKAADEGVKAQYASQAAEAKAIAPPAECGPKRANKASGKVRAAAESDGEEVLPATVAKAPWEVELEEEEAERMARRSMGWTG